LLHGSCTTNLGWRGQYSDQATGLGFESCQSQTTFFLSKTSLPVLEPPYLLFHGLWEKRPLCEANHSPPSSAEVKNEWSYTSTPPTCLHDVDRNNFTLLCRYIKGKYVYKLLSVLTEFCSVKAYGYKKVEFHALLNSALNGGEWLPSRSSLFTQGKKAPGAHCVGDSVGPIVSLGAVVMRVALILPPHFQLVACLRFQELVLPLLNTSSTRAGNRTPIP